MKVRRCRVELHLTIDLASTISNHAEISGAVKNHFDAYQVDKVRVLHAEMVDSESETYTDNDEA